MSFMLRSRFPYGAVRAVLAAALVFAFSAGLWSPAFAAGGQTGNLQGSVIDATTKAPVVGATVAAVSPSGTGRAVTDARGFFSILGLQVDTYTISVESKGYDSMSATGITVQGDQTISIGTLNATKQLKRIGQVTARAPSSVFQPSQTTDSYTITGSRILETTGKAASTDEKALVQAVPGVSLTDSGNITIRGGLRTEVGYQFDGVDFTEPFFSQNGSSNRFNGVGSLQVVEGAGDATQGNIGAGSVNLVPKRGTYPGSGILDFETGGPNYSHQIQIEYGFATQNGRVSNYFAYNGQRVAPYQGYTGANAAAYDNFYQNAFSLTGAYEKNDDLLDNFVFKFGHNNNQSLQILYDVRNLQEYGNYGGIAGQQEYYNDPTDPVAEFLFPSLSNYSNLIGLNPGTNYGHPLTAPEQIANNPTRYLKFEYDSNIDANTFLQARYYNLESLQTSSNNTGSTDATPVSFGLGAAPTYNSTGGPRVGVTADITRQIGSKNTLTLSTKYENAHPVWDGYDPNAEAFLLGVGASGDGPLLSDFEPGGYIYKYFGGKAPRIPNSGIDYNGANFQTFGVGLREQYSPNSRLHFDLGGRLDGQNQHYGINPFNPLEPGNPSDVDPANISRKYLNPRELQPRTAVSYQMGRNDAVRVSYGRSVEFLNAQTAGTPAGLYNTAAFANVPAKPTTVFTCGSGTNPAGALPCQNYAQQLYWLYDQNFDAPDLGGALPALYSNYDVSYQHQFKDGFGLKITPFYRLGVNIPSFALVQGLAAGAAVFTANNQGLSRTTGTEIGLTTPEHPFGFSGFLSATYQNVLSSTPPLISGEDALPINGSGSLILNDIYRAGYVSPFVVRVGGQFKTKSGFRINPVIEYDRGYPYSVGNLIASSSPVNGKFQNIPQVNFGPGETAIPGFQQQTGASNSTNYYDPAYSGNSLNPNIAATRGTAATSATGGALYRGNVYANLTVEYKTGRNTFGVQLLNLAGNAYNNVIPQINPYYQPVATGVSGPQTGVNPFTTTNPNRGFANIPKDAYAFTNGAYLIIPQQPMSFQLYYQIGI